MSTVRATVSSRDSRTANRATTIAPTATGRFRKKIDRHLTLPPRKPAPRRPTAAQSGPAVTRGTVQGGAGGTADERAGGQDVCQRRSGGTGGAGGAGEGKRLGLAGGRGGAAGGGGAQTGGREPAEMGGAVIAAIGGFAALPGRSATDGGGQGGVARRF